MYCANCGKEVPEGKAFCGHCGAVVGVGQARGGQEDHFTPGYAQPAASLPAPKGNKRALLWSLIIAALLLAAGLAIVLVLIMGKGGDEAGKAEAVMRDYVWALERKDVELLKEIMEPDFLDELKKVVGRDWQEVVEDSIFAEIPDDLKIEIEETEVSVKGDRATLRVIKGKMTYTDEGGKKVTERAEDSEVEDMEVVRVDGRWYLSGDWLKEHGYDPDILAAMKRDEGKSEEEEKEKGKGKDSGTADPEMAVMTYLDKTLGPGYQLVELVVSGTEAWGAAIDPSGSSALNIMAVKDAGGWRVEDAGYDLDYPGWYEREYLLLESAMQGYISANSEAGLTFQLTDLVIRKNEAAGIAVCTNAELEQILVLMRRGNGNWYGIGIGTDIDPPWWYDVYLDFKFSW